MARYVALLRGVNVGGVTSRSADVAEVFTSLGHTGVKTVLASGNVLFETEARGSARATTTLKTAIEKALGDRFGYTAWIVLVPHDDLAGIVDGYPYEEQPSMQPYVVFAADRSALRKVVALAGEIDPAASGERAEAGPGVVYWECPKGHSLDTAFAKHLAKAAFSTTTTTRNLRTLRKLV